MATGTRSFGQHILEANEPNRVDEDFENFIDYDDKTIHPMTAWLSKKENSEQKDTEEFTLFAGELIPRTLTTTVTITTTDAAAVITVSSTDGIVANTLLSAGIGDSGTTAPQLMRVTAVTTRLAVTRLTTEAQIPDNSTIVIIGNHDNEVSTTGPDAFDMEPSSVTGRMTILKRRIDITKTERNSAVRGAPNRLSEKLERSKLDFMLDIEHNSWLSRTSTDASNSLRFSMGIIPQIVGDASAVTTDAGGNDLVAADLGDTVAQAARWSASKNYTCFHGQQLMAGLWELALADLEVSQKDTVWGVSATSVAAPGGFTLDFVYARVFDIMGDPYASMVVGLEMTAVKNVHLKEGRPRLQRNVHTDDSGEKESHQWRYQGGVSITTPKRHWLIVDITNIA